MSLPEKITLKSGSTLELQMADFDDAMRLFQTIANELKTVDVHLDGLTIEQIKGTDINGIKNAILQLLGSTAMIREIRSCAARSLYNGNRITKDSFNPPEARQDFLPVAWEVIKFTLAPFFAGLDLSSMMKKRTTTGSAPE